MSVAAAITQLESLAKKAKLIAESIYHNKVCQSEGQYCSLEALNKRLQEAAVVVAG